MNVLYIMSTYNLYGGTPKKTLDLMKFSEHNSCLYVFNNSYPEFKPAFDEHCSNIYEGFYGRNVIKHLKLLLRVIDENKIDVVQTQFTFGEILGALIKVFRPKIKVICAFVVPFSPRGFKRFLLPFIYRKMDAFVYISKYVKFEKEKAFPLLAKLKSKIIYNGTERRLDSGEKVDALQGVSLLDVAGLADWKNANVLLEAVSVLKHNFGRDDIYLYIAGDGPERVILEQKISDLKLVSQVTLLGYSKNIGALLSACSIFVHPAYAEGFGIAVAEAMIEGKPIIVSNAGALPELIEANVSGLVVDPFNKNEWVDAILKFAEDAEFSKEIGAGASLRAAELFSVESYVSSYQTLYSELGERS